MSFLLSAALLTLIFLAADDAQGWVVTRRPELNVFILTDAVGGLVVYAVWFIAVTLAGLPSDVGPVIVGGGAYLAVVYVQARVRRWRRNRD